MRIALLGPGKGSLYRQVVFLCRWSLGQVQLYLFPQKSSSSILNGIPQPSSSYVSSVYIKPDAISRVLQFISINFQYRLPQIYLNTVTIIFCTVPASLPGKFHYTIISAPTFIISTEVYSHQHSHQ